MKRNQSATKQKASALMLRKETLRQLEDSKLQGAVGAVRIWKPVGFAEDTTPVYDWVDEP